MRICVTGIAGFVGSSLASFLAGQGLAVFGIDSLARRGSESNLARLKRAGVEVIHGDIRLDSDVRALPKCDWLIDCAAMAAVTAGLSGDSALLIEHNLMGTLRLLEKCRNDQAGFLLLSTSRVYSVDALNALPLVVRGDRFALDPSAKLPEGTTMEGISRRFSTQAPISLYGATKLASETMALEYGEAFRFPVWINRCGVLAGAGQFGRADQGIFSYWMYRWILDQPLRYIGFGGRGHQVRDFLDPRDLAALVARQIRDPSRAAPRVVNVGGGNERTRSLAELSSFCRERFGRAVPVAETAETRPYDMPYYVTDNAEVTAAWDWRPSIPAVETLESIASWALEHRGTLAEW